MNRQSFYNKPYHGKKYYVRFFDYSLMEILLKKNSILASPKLNYTFL